MQGAAFVVAIIVARLFGANLQTDAYFLALSIPSIFNAAHQAALKAVFIPVVTRYLKENPAEEKKLLGSLYFSLLLFSSACFVVMYILAPYYVPPLASGMSPQGRLLATQLTRELLPLVIIRSFIALFASIFNSYHHFLTPIIFPIFRTLILLFFVLNFKTSLGIHALSFGTVAGDLLQLVILVGVMKWRRICLGLSFCIHPAMKHMVRLSVMPLVGSMILAFNPVVDKIMIASTAIGSVTALNYASKLTDIPLTLLGAGGFMSVVLAHWSKLNAERNIAEVVKSLEKSINMLLFILMPLVTIFLVLREPIITFLYQHKEFTPDDARITATLFGILALSILPLLVGRVLVRVYFVLEDTTTPFWLGIALTGLNTLFNFAFKPVWGMEGIAFSTAFTALIVTLINFWVLKRRVPEFNQTSLGKVFGKVLGAALVMGLVVSGSYPLLLPIFRIYQIGELDLNIFAAGLLSGVLGLGVYALIAAYLRMEEWQIIWSRVRNRV